MATSGRLYEILMPLSCEVTKPSSSEEETALTLGFGDRRGRRKDRLEVFPSNAPPEEFKVHMKQPGSRLSYYVQ